MVVWCPGGLLCARTVPDFLRLYSTDLINVRHRPSPPVKAWLECTEAREGTRKERLARVTAVITAGQTGRMRTRAIKVEARLGDACFRLLNARPACQKDGKRQRQKKKVQNVICVSFLAGSAGQGAQKELRKAPAGACLFCLSAGSEQAKRPCRTVPVSGRPGRACIFSVCSPVSKRHRKSLVLHGSHWPIFFL